MEGNNKLSVFQGKDIRRIWHEDKLYLNLVDIIEILTESPDPAKYWFKVKKKMKETEGINEFSPIWRKLKFQASDGKYYQMDAADTEGVLRIIMSVPSPKAEPLKQWLAQVGTERIQETENPELGYERMTEIYKAKGYSDEWIKERLQSIQTRKRLTDEWKNRGVKEGQEYSILTATIAKGTFGLNPSEHKKLKGIEKPNQELRDHMTPLELIFTALGEEITRSLAVKDNAQGFNENHEVAQIGGNEAGKARRNLEKNTGLKVISEANYLKTNEDKKLIKKT
jgi:DNA-damage-inducible protein D